MKAVTITDIEKAELREYPMPTVGENDVLIQIKACALCTMEQRICCPWGGGIFTYSFEKNRRQRRSLHLPQLCGNKVLYDRSDLCIFKRHFQL